MNNEKRGAWFAGGVILAGWLLSGWVDAFEVKRGAAPAPGASVSGANVLRAHPVARSPVVVEVSVLPVAPVAAPRAPSPISEVGKLALKPADVVHVEPAAPVVVSQWPMYAGKSAPRLRPCLGARGVYSDTCVHEK